MSFPVELGGSGVIMCLFPCTWWNRLEASAAADSWGILLLSAQPAAPDGR